MNKPETVYINWAAYDELTDDIPLTEELAMRQLDELLQLRELGVRFDYYLMDAFWYEPGSAFREWRKPHWPKGPDRWLKKCLDHDVKPGLWFPTNTFAQSKCLPAHPRWKSSLVRGDDAASLFEGPFLGDWMTAMQEWYDRGVRMFKLDFAHLELATPEGEAQFLPDEIRDLNSKALRQALISFRTRNPEVRFLAFNGFGGVSENTSLPFRKTVDVRWLDAFDSLYCGDPRLADVPCMNFWRAKDIYSDHMVRHYEKNGIPLERIDNCSFMIGLTGTCYGRGTAAWKGMLLLSLARGGWMNTYYGNLELLDDEKARWFAKAQSLFLPLQEFGRTQTFGGIPGEGMPYGYVSQNGDGALVTLINPSQATAKVDLRAPFFPGLIRDGRILFTDKGFGPQLIEDSLTLGPEQMCVIGTGKYNRVEYELGSGEGVLIPSSILPIKTAFKETHPSVVSATVVPPKNAGLRIVMRQIDEKGVSVRSTGGAPPKGTSLEKILTIEVRQEGKIVPLHLNYDKAIWSGLSWAVAEAERGSFSTTSPLEIVCSTKEERKRRLVASAYAVTYP